MAISAGPDISESGLILNLNAIDYRSYRGTGTGWIDTSGAGNNITLYNDPVFSCCPATFTFNGTDEYGSAGDNDNLMPSTITVETFTAATNEVNLTHVMNIVGKGNWNSAGRLILGYKSGGFLTFVYRCGGWYEGAQYSLNDFDATQWHHIVGTSDGTADRLYLDGVLVNSSTSNYTTSTLNNDDFLIADSYVGYAKYPGKIALVRVYNRALNLNEIQQNYTAIRGRFGI